MLRLCLQAPYNLRVVEAQSVLHRRRTDDLDGLTGHLADALVVLQEADEAVVLSGGQCAADLDGVDPRSVQAFLAASDPAFLNAVLDDERGWRELTVPPGA